MLLLKYVKKKCGLNKTVSTLEFSDSGVDYVVDKYHFL